jgi:hypothetical protein
MATTPLVVPEPGRAGEYWRRSRVVSAAAEAANVVELIEIPPNTFVLEVALIVLVAMSGGTPSLTAGDTANAAGWLAATDITEVTPGSYRSAAATPYAAPGKYYTSRDRLTVTVSAAAAAGSFVLLARCLDYP